MKKEIKLLVPRQQAKRQPILDAMAEMISQEYGLKALEDSKIISEEDINNFENIHAIEDPDKEWIENLKCKMFESCKIPVHMMEQSDDMAQSIAKAMIRAQESAKLIKYKFNAVDFISDSYKKDVTDLISKASGIPIKFLAVDAAVNGKDKNIVVISIHLSPIDILRSTTDPEEILKYTNGINVIKDLFKGYEEVRTGPVKYAIYDYSLYISNEIKRCE